MNEAKSIKKVTFNATELILVDGIGAGGHLRCLGSGERRDSP
jgi:hypothetical protein